jgi:sulfoxide reductase heme-binding subunit YedZ
MTDASIQRATPKAEAGRGLAPQAKPRLKAPRYKAPWQVWRDAAGRLSALRIVTLAFLAVPIAIAIYDYNTAGFGARPLNDVIHRAGYWALIFLMVALAITPLRRIARFNQLADVRRMIGVAAFVYIAAHLGLYIADQMFDLSKVASEIALRLYLTIGFVALLGLAALAATSTDGMVRWLGTRRWQRLHTAIYGIAILALIHFFQQTKADVWLPTLVAGLFGWMIGYRLLLKWRTRRDELPSWMLALLSIAVAVLTFVGEAVGIAIVFNVSPFRILGMAFEFYDLESVRPGWWVLAAGLLVVAVDIIRARFGRRRSVRVAPKTSGERPA